MIKRSEEFKQEAVRIALTSGLPRDRVASDLGIGKSTLNKWVSHYRPWDVVAAPQADLARENERLRLENRVLRGGGNSIPGVLNKMCGADRCTWVILSDVTRMIHTVGGDRSANLGRG